VARQTVRTTIRIGPKVEHADHDDLLSALLALRERLTQVRPSNETKTVFKRDYAPIAQVLARGELRGADGGRGGVDLRGDGSAEAWTGRFRRRVVAQQAGEDAYAALARVLGG
jgi:hypothetical protein